MRSQRARRHFERLVRRQHVGLRVGPFGDQRRIANEARVAIAAIRARAR
jgi:hypothetical protein